MTFRHDISLGHILLVVTFGHEGDDILCICFYTNIGTDDDELERQR